jgi:hypothetical protein
MIEMQELYRRKIVIHATAAGMQCASVYPRTVNQWTAQAEDCEAPPF